VPSHRSVGVGRLLLDAVKAYGRERGWSRIDVTAPESPRWDRTRRFYEREGFTFTGPKLKFVF
jgi:GNAT superfamily N-acetyltransferase